MEGYQRNGVLQQVGEVLDGADHLRNVGVLVVVPGNDLNLGHAAGQLVDHGLGSIEQGAEGHADDVGGDDLVLGVAVGLSLSNLHGSVDVSNGDFLSDNSVQDGGGAGRRGDTLSSAGGVGNDVDSTSAGAAQVALSLGAVQDQDRKSSD